MMTEVLLTSAVFSQEVPDYCVSANTVFVVTLALALAVKGTNTTYCVVAIVG